MPPRLVLASASPFRKALLENAGLAFDVESARIDERVIEQTLDGLTAEDVATVLAEAKAQDVSDRNPGALVIGSDQTLSLGGEIFHKPADMEEARRRLLQLSGRTHALNSAVALVRDGETIWRHVSVARMTMRELDPGFIGRHLSNVGSPALSSVGAYQFEGEGLQLFDRFEGDYFTIIGLPMLPLLAKLRELQAIDG
ncbi:Maf-like protein [Hoeflea ulvae]|uniref:7-methyl-GTP pyrophosphatase n=1 Tax=Hoeflea ulvae TaxID=2983764 RepID=A0ABT3YAC3_9HYPH|nr:Maf-like protein [Hoeflea ulvae]MCY0092818.1 Maf-like protein [Hoeflea ulvae]